MADLSQFFDEGFDDSSVPVSTGVPEPVPEGDYTLMMESGEVKMTKNQDGALFAAVMAVATGPFEGRKIFPQFNIRNKNATAQQIGIGEFKALCQAAGVNYELARNDTDLLIGKPFGARVGFDKANINPQTQQPYPPKNRIMKFLQQMPSQSPAVAKAAPAPVAATSPAPTANTPWGS